MTRRRRTLRAGLDWRRGCAEADAPPLCVQRKAEVAESIVLALSSGLYDYTSFTRSDDTVLPPRSGRVSLAGSLPKSPETMSEPVTAERVRLQE